MKKNVMDCYICSDKDGTYCLPKSYTSKGEFSKLLDGHATEELTKRIIEEQYQGGDIFHAGAFVGDFFPALSRIVGDENRVISCEPVPNTFVAATHTIALSGLKNVHCSQVALGREKGTLEITTEDINGSSYAQTARFGAPGKTVEVLTTTIDDLCNGYNTRIIHLDLEGYEKEALFGATKTLNSSKLDLIILENFQLRVVSHFLEGYTCLGTADNNYFFSKKVLSGNYINQARRNLQVKFEKIVNSYTPTAISEKPLDEEVSADDWIQFEKEILNPTLSAAKGGMYSTRKHTLSASVLLKLGRLGFRTNEILDFLGKFFLPDCHPNVAYAYGALAFETGKSTSQVQGLIGQLSDKHKTNASLALLASKLAEESKDLDSAISFMARACAAQPNDKIFDARHEMLKNSRKLD